MMVGEQNTGKTTIARYLVGKGPTRTRISTDGIELFKGLSFFDLDDDYWLGGKQGHIIILVIFPKNIIIPKYRQINI